MQQGERDFEQISKSIRREVGRFEVSSAVSVSLLSLLNTTLVSLTSASLSLHRKTE